jgi:phosphohistidine swiveling domain-containing protein
LSEAQVRELAKLLLYIEKHYGAAQDVEWCWEKGQFWIVQSRPVTGAAGNKTEIEWTRANVREVLPDLPCPQVVHEVKRIIDQAQREHFGKLWAPEEELGPIIKEFCGRLYFNLSQLLQVSAIFGAPPARLMRAFGGPKLRPEDERVPPLRAGRVLRALPSLLRVLSYQFHLGGAVRWSVGACDAEVQRLEGEKPEAKSDEEIWKTLRRPDSEVTRRMKVIFTLAGLTLYEDLLQTLLGRAGLSADDLIQPFLAAGGKSVSAQQAFDLLRLAKVARDEERAREYFRTHEEYGNYREALAGSEFLRRWEEFLKLYGHRGLYESDWSLPRYAEDPSPLLAALRAHVLAPSGPAPEDILSQQEQRAGEAWARFENQLNAIQRVMLRPAVRWLLRRLKQMFIWREQVRSEMVRVMSAQRPWHLALAARFAERGWIEKPADYFLMTFEEIAAGLHADGERAEWKRLVAERTTELEVWSEIEMPLLLRESDLANLRRRRNAAPIAEGRRLQGLCVSRGCAEGEVVVLRTPHDFARMKRGAIIVAPATDPSWTPLFTLAAGVIVEIGGMLSHASTVAREYGLPALANVTGATRFFKDGDRVRLDATQGIVELVAQEHAEV